MKGTIRIIVWALSGLLALPVSAQQAATVRIDAGVKHQHITGFGGFVCSPQFQYDHMSSSDISRVWGSGSVVGCNIMRLYIPIGKGNWWQSLETAKKAKQMGLIVFASPWGQPSEWKTNNSSDARTSQGVDGSLKKENWADYAQYLEDYVQYMRENGVELDAISIQNEPDWPAQYAGCLWSATDIAEFVKTYGRQISCRIMAPETLAVSDSYANALNKSDILPCFDIYGGHQYGGIQSAYKNLAAKGKEVWMTEYLINWNEGKSTSRNFDFSKDFFDFFRAINVCMLGDFNAWVHYAAKRFYGLLGDGQMGTSAGAVTKRGYIMAHFARFVTGMTRIDMSLGESGLEGSAYLSQTGDTVVAVLANSTSSKVSLTIDLPFYTKSGKLYYTGKSNNFKSSNVSPAVESCRPQVEIPAQCVSTVLFVRSRDRMVSDMKGSSARFDRIDDMSALSSLFGTSYKLSGQTRTFDHSNPIISSNTSSTNGYVVLNNRYDQLVMQVRKVSSSMNYSSAKTTLNYINSKGVYSSHDYGEFDLSKRENFNLVFDISPKTLTDGCKGIVSITNNNWSSVLTITFGDVYLKGASSPYYASLSGSYVPDDANVLNYTSDANCTSLDMTNVTDVPEYLDWMSGNRVVYVDEAVHVNNANVVSGSSCDSLLLYEEGGDFRPVRSFIADKAVLKLTVDGCRFVTVPFDAAVPAGVSAFVLNNNMEAVRTDTIYAHTPVLIKAEGVVLLEGSGQVSFRNASLSDRFRGTYVSSTLAVGDYVLAFNDNRWGLSRVTQEGVLSPFGVYAQLSTTESFIPFKSDELSVGQVLPGLPIENQAVYDLTGRKVMASELAPGIYIVGGKKVVIR